MFYLQEIIDNLFLERLIEVFIVFCQLTRSYYKYKFSNGGVFINVFDSKR